MTGRPTYIPLADESASPGFLHPALLANSGRRNITYDVRSPIGTAYIAKPEGPKALNADLRGLAIRPPTVQLKVFAHFLSWPIVISNPAGVTLGDVLDSTRKAVVDTENWLDFQSSRGDALAKFARQEARRVGVLARHVWFVGLRRTKIRWHGRSGASTVEESWVLELSDDPF